MPFSRSRVLFDSPPLWSGQAFHLTRKVPQVDHLTLQRHEPGVRLSELLAPIRGRESRREPLGLGTELLVHRAEPIELRAIPLVPFAIVSFELGEGHAEPLDLDPGRSPLDREAVPLSDRHLELRLAVTDQRRESIGFGAEPIDFGPQPIDLGADLLDPFLLLPLEPRERDTEPLGFGRGTFPLGSDAFAVGEGRCEIGFAVTDQRRESIGFGAEPIDLGPQTIDLCAAVLDPFLLLALEPRDRDAEPLGFGRGAILFGSDAFAVGEGRCEIGLAVTDQRRESIGFGAEPIDFGPQPIDLGAVLLDPFLLLPLEPRDRDTEPLGFGRGALPLGSDAVDVATEALDLTSEPLDQGSQQGPLLRDRPDLAGRDLAQLAEDRSQVGREPIPLLLKPVASGTKILPLGGESIPILGGFIPLRLEPVASGREPIPLLLKPVASGTKILPLGGESIPILGGFIPLRLEPVASGREPIPLLLKPVASGTKILPFGGESIPILGGFIPLRLEPVASGRDPVVRGSQLLDLGSQSPISGQEFGMGCLQPHMRPLELPVRRKKPFVLRQNLVVHRLEPLVLGGDLLALTAQSLELLAEDIGTNAGRAPVLLEAGGPGAGKIGDDEGHFALFAADLTSETGSPNARARQCSSDRLQGSARPGPRATAGSASRRVRHHSRPVPPKPRRTGRIACNGPAGRDKPA